jgi:uncharacterized protein (DUF697 family)
VVLAGGAAMAVGPLPALSGVLVTAIEIRMVINIAKIYGFDLSRQEGTLIVGRLIVPYSALKTAATETSTFVPVLGWWIAKPSLAAATTKAIGEGAIRYFEDRQQQKDTRLSSHTETPVDRSSK